jgi:hypothetical protein
MDALSCGRCRAAYDTTREVLCQHCEDQAIEAVKLDVIAGRLMCGVCHTSPKGAEQIGSLLAVSSAELPRNVSLQVKADDLEPPQFVCSSCIAGHGIQKDWPGRFRVIPPSFPLPPGEHLPQLFAAESVFFAPLLVSARVKPAPERFAEVGPELTGRIRFVASDPLALLQRLQEQLATPHWAGKDPLVSAAFHVAVAADCDDDDDDDENVAVGQAVPLVYEEGTAVRASCIMQLLLELADANHTYKSVCLSLSTAAFSVQPMQGRSPEDWDQVVGGARRWLEGQQQQVAETLHLMVRVGQDQLLNASDLQPAMCPSAIVGALHPRLAGAGWNPAAMGLVSVKGAAAAAAAASKHSLNSWRALTAVATAPRPDPGLLLVICHMQQEAGDKEKNFCVARKLRPMLSDGLATLLQTLPRELEQRQKENANGGRPPMRLLSPLVRQVMAMPAELSPKQAQQLGPTDRVRLEEFFRGAAREGRAPNIWCTFVFDLVACGHDAPPERIAECTRVFIMFVDRLLGAAVEGGIFPRLLKLAVRYEMSELRVVFGRVWELCLAVRGMRGSCVWPCVGVVFGRAWNAWELCLAVCGMRGSCVWPCVGVVFGRAWNAWELCLAVCGMC